MSAAFLANLSHELRVRLRGVTRWVAVLAAADHDRETVERAVRELEQSLHRQAALADDLLEISHLAAGQLAMSWTTVDVVAALRESVERQQPAAARRRVTLELAPAADPLLIAGDARRLRQAADRLLTAAIARAVDGQRVQIHIQAVDAGCEIEISGDAQGGGSADTPDEREESRHAPGAVGLLLARQLIEAHGGSMDVVRDRGGPGATFRVHLPRQAAAVPPRARQTRERRLLEGLRVLVVDDDRGTREALAEALTHFGARPVVAASVAAALARLRGERFDAVCSDLEMPGDSGIALAHRLRATETGWRQPLIAITGLVGDEHEAAAQRAGFDACVAKPVDVSRLARRLRALIDAAGRRGRGSPTIGDDGT